jgi:hypothetical protein
MTFILVLFLASQEIATFHTTRELCFETLEAHQQGALVIAWDKDGKQWPAERVLCLEKIEDETQEPMS